MTTKREDRIVRVRSMESHERTALRIRVPRAYWVTCRVCPPTRGAIDFVASLFGDKRARLGWSPSWDMAMKFADAHAQLHADKACPTCRHIPETPVSLTDTHALMQVRAS